MEPKRRIPGELLKDHMMNRRNFVRIIGGMAFTAGVAPRYGFGAEGKGADLLKKIDTEQYTKGEADELLAEERAMDRRPVDHVTRGAADGVQFRYAQTPGR